MANNLSVTPEVRYATAEMIRFHFRQELSQYVLNDMRVDVALDDFSRRLVAQVSFYLAGKREEKTATKTTEAEAVVGVVRVPDGWWQAFKAALGLKARHVEHPVLLRTTTHHHHVEELRVCPHLAVPDQHRHVTFLSFPTAEAGGISG